MRKTRVKFGKYNFQSWIDDIVDQLDISTEAIGEAIEVIGELKGIIETDLRNHPFKNAVLQNLFIISLKLNVVQKQNANSKKNISLIDRVTAELVEAMEKDD